ncbi:MAG: HAMP domain-containing sensor histidine kinase [Thiohalocapsa sp.]
MTRQSLRARLAVAGALSIAVALVVAAVGLVTLFERHVERRIGDELVGQLNGLAAAARLDDSGMVSVDPRPADPRFQRPQSGLYWQIDDLSVRNPVAGLLRSRSLWDTALELPADRLGPGGIHAHLVPGPGGQTLLARERSIRLDSGGNPRALRLIAALDRNELTAARDAFAADALPYLGIIALVLGLATWLQIRIGLAPLESVRRGVNAIRDGHELGLSDDYPDEVMPLVSEVNGLLSAREQAVERARAWTADLAHGLKTPLSALTADAERLRAQGNPLLAKDLEQLAETMRRRVERELIRARLRSGAQTQQARADAIDILCRLLNTLQRTPDGARVRWQLNGPASAQVAMAPDDLMELLGNLLENAAKWAHSAVVIDAETDESLIIRIGDDGPGVPPARLNRLGERGLRLDQRKAGTGLGLAIARDVVDAYGGTLAFGTASAGGLEVRVKLPAAPD